MPMPDSSDVSIGEKPQDRRSRWSHLPKREQATKKPWIVRWRVAGEPTSRSFRTSIIAEDFRQKLLRAAAVPQEWDQATFLPTAWEVIKKPSVASVAREFFLQEWADLQPNSRRSLGEALVRFVAVSSTDAAPELTEAERTEFRREVGAWLSNSAYTPTPWIQEWLDKYSPPIDSLVDEAIKTDRLAEIDGALKIKDDGGAAASATWRRYRSGVSRCMKFAVGKGYISSFKFPEDETGEKNRKNAKRGIARKNQALRDLPKKDGFLRILEMSVNDQPESYRYRAMNAVGGLAGLRPGEVAILKVEDLKFEESGAPYLEIALAWPGAGEDWGESEENSDLPKTAAGRRVYIPNLLVDEINDWCKRAQITSGPMFLTPDGKPPTNWARSLAKACEKAGIKKLSPYGLRHTNATMQMTAGVPLGAIAEQLGNSIEVLVKHYLGYLEGSQLEARERFQDFLSA